MKPIIGIISSKELNQSQYMVNSNNVKAIEQAGGMPFMLPYLLEDKDIEQIANQIDGLYATGGYDIDPTLFGEEPHPKLGSIIPARDSFEITLMKKMLEMDKAILGVCRGSQTLNIVTGGDMYQDIYSQIDKQLLQHSQKAPREYGSHFVNVLKGSLLHRIIGEEKIRVNSYHHQANRNVSVDFRVSGTANDGVVEAIESKKHRFALGVQWHPEAMVQIGDVPSIMIYEAFIKACKEN